MPNLEPDLRFGSAFLPDLGLNFGSELNSGSPMLYHQMYK